MLTVYEVHLAEKASAANILSKEIITETSAQIMTVDEARKVGFKGLPDLGPNVRLIAVNKRDGQWIQRALESNPDVERFNVHHVD